MANPEYLLINAILNGGDWNAVVKRGLHQRRFLQAASEWKWLVEHFRDYGAAPGDDAVDSLVASMRRQNRSYVFDRATDTSEPIDFYLNEVERFHRKHRLTGIFLEAADASLAENWQPIPALIDQAKAALDETAGSTRLRTVRLSDVQAKAIVWEWHGRIARGKLTNLLGDGGAGKGLVVADLMARVSTGRPMPLEPEALAFEAAPVLFVCDEDGIEDTIKPRIAAAGGDVDAVHVIAEDELIAFPNDLGRLRSEVLYGGHALVVIDSSSGYIAEGLRQNQGEDMQRMLKPFSRLAKELDIPILMIWHPNKSWDAPAQYRVAGATAIRNIARGLLVVGSPPDIDDPDIRVVASNKNNIGKTPPAIGFRIVDAQMKPERVGETDVIETARIEWLDEPMDYVADDLFAKRKTKTDERLEQKLDRAKDILLTMMQEGGGKVAKRDAVEQGRFEFISQRTMERAAEELKLRTTQEPEKGKRGPGVAVWSRIAAVS